MKKTFSIILLGAFLLQPLAVSALTSSEAKQEWFKERNARFEYQDEHRQAKLNYAASRTPKNDQAVVDASRNVFDGVLDEVVAWLLWKEAEAEENPEVPEQIKQSISRDVGKNLSKVDTLRADVDSIENRLEAGIVFLKMVGAYAGLLADVAKNSGAMWAHIGGEKVATAEDYEAELREVAEGIEDNEEIMSKLNLAKADLYSAQDYVDAASSDYADIRVPGQPLINFKEGNDNLRSAKEYLLSAHGYLVQAYNLIIKAQ